MKKTVDVPLTKADADALRRMLTYRRVPKKTRARLLQRGLLREEAGLYYVTPNALRLLRGA